MLTKSGRQQRSYERYVRKSSVTRAKQRSHFRSASPKIAPVPDAPATSTSAANDGPESVGAAPPPP